MSSRSGSSVHREGRVILEEPAVEPLHGLESDPAPDGHRPKQIPCQRGEILRSLPGVFEHAGEHGVGQQSHILGEHAEHEAVDEVSHLLRGVALVPERLGELREGLGGGVP